MHWIFRRKMLYKSFKISNTSFIFMLCYSKQTYITKSVRGMLHVSESVLNTRRLRHIFKVLWLAAKFSIVYALCTFKLNPLQYFASRSKNRDTFGTEHWLIMIIYDSVKMTPRTTAPNSEVCFDRHSMKSYGEEEEWKPNDCTVCKCRGGQPMCVATVCRHPNCRHPVRVEGLCCPKCPRNASTFSVEGK